MKRESVCVCAIGIGIGKLELQCGKVEKFKSRYTQDKYVCINIENIAIDNGAQLFTFTRYLSVCDINRNRHRKTLGSCFDVRNT